MWGTYGHLNGHIVGICLKELVRRAINSIRLQRGIFTQEAKVGLSGNEDVVTSADQAAQTHYLKSLLECFPRFGVIAEENGCRVGCTFPLQNAHFSVDGLDGTKAWVRRQSHGIGTMVAMNFNGEIISAWVGDAMTQEIFGFRPDSDSAWRIHDYGEQEKVEKLQIDENLSLCEQYILLRHRPDNYPVALQKMIKVPSGGGLFKDLEVTGGSIGLSFARLWKGEVGGIMMTSGHRTPWDMWPVIGISKKLGFVWLRPLTPHACRFEPYEPKVSLEVEYCDHPTIVIHQSRLSQLLAWSRG